MEKGRTMLQRLIVAAVTLGVLGAATHAPASNEGTLWENPHRTYVTSYEGTKTCLTCHEAQAKQVFHSIHYQWKAEATNIVNANGRKLGKLNTNNDFCTNPAVSWIAILKNDQGKVIGNGCSKCHAGLGAKPSEDMTQAQLENIDCLICHSQSYRRTVVQKEDKSLVWQPALLANKEAMLNIAQNVGRPTTEICLRCHAGSGGGMNFKRGDLESEHARADADFDVHMGNGMSCIQCHKFRQHQVMGSGTQMSGTDRPGENPSCESCHRGQVHADAMLNRHTASVYCTTCHIPVFAKKEATDMDRDWGRAQAISGEGRFEPVIRHEKNVRPVYAWWNRKGEVALLGEPVKLNGRGRVGIYTPQGSIADPAAKIYAFKLHTAKLPVDSATRMLLPIQVGIVFRMGKNDPAIKAGAKAHYGKETAAYEMVATERYMALFHEVAPKGKALACADCHGGGRLDWKALGYAGDPMQVGGRRVASAQP